MVQHNLRKVSLIIVKEGRKLSGQVRKLGRWKVPVIIIKRRMMYGLDLESILNISYAHFFTNTTYESNVGDIVGSSVGNST